MKSTLTFMGFALACLTLSSCATIYEQCSNTNEASRYGGYDSCVAAKQRQAEAYQRASASVSNAMSKQNVYQAPVNNEPQKQVDYNCLNRCTRSGSTYSYCNSKCSY